MLSIGKKVMSHFQEKGEDSMRKIILMLAAAVVLFAIYLLVTQVCKPALETDVKLPLLAITGVVLLLAVLALVSMSFGLFGLSDKTQALALPQGSIRAVIALSFVIQFAILSLFLYQGLASGGTARTVADLTDSDKADFLNNNKTATDIVVRETTNGKGKRYTITYRAPNDPSSQDFAQQLLVMMGTLMTAMAGFYFGSRAASASQPTDAIMRPPMLRNVQPTSFSLATGSVIELQILGDNLNSIKQVKIANQGNQVLATDVVSNDSLVKCKVAVSATTPTGRWDVIAIDGASKSSNLPGALTIAP